MGSTILFWTYLLVMAAAMACFVQAYRTRFDTPRHKRWGLIGSVLALGGIVVVIVVSYGLQWIVPKRFPEVVLWHRRVAYVATALLLLVGVSGARRWAIHKRLYLVFLPVFAIALVLAMIGYRP